MSDESPKPNGEEISPSHDDWENRTLCPDESCIGVIGPDGRCKECGESYEGSPPDEGSETQTASESDEDVNTDETARKDFSGSDWEKEEFLKSSRSSAKTKLAASSMFFSRSAVKKPRATLSGSLSSTPDWPLSSTPDWPQPVTTSVSQAMPMSTNIV